MDQEVTDKDVDDAVAEEQKERNGDSYNSALSTCRYDTWDS